MGQTKDGWTVTQPRVRPEGKGTTKTTGSKWKTIDGGVQGKKKAKVSATSRPKTRLAMEPEDEIPVCSPVRTLQRSPAREGVASHECSPTAKKMELSMGDEHNRIIQSSPREEAASKLTSTMVRVKALKNEAHLGVIDLIPGIEDSRS